MSEIARRILGMSEREIFDHDFSSPRSVSETFGMTHRNIRVFAGMIAGTLQDRNPERRKLRKVPLCLRKRGCLWE